MKKAKVILSHSQEYTLPDGTELILTIENYDSRINEVNTPMTAVAKVEYKKNKTLRFMESFEHHFTMDDMIYGVNKMVKRLNEDLNDLRWQHAPK